MQAGLAIAMAPRIVRFWLPVLSVAFMFLTAYGVLAAL